MVLANPKYDASHPTCCVHYCVHAMSLWRLQASMVKRIAMSIHPSMVFLFRASSFW